MTDSPLPKHWQFALANTCHRLTMLVRAFDFRREVGHLPYFDLTPMFLVEVIEGFLGERPGVVWPGNRSELVQLRELLNERIIPAYGQGVEAARKHWEKTGQPREFLEVQSLHDAAFRLAPSDDLVRGWFVEGFAATWKSVELDSFRPPGSKAKNLE